MVRQQCRKRSGGNSVPQGSGDSSPERLSRSSPSRSEAGSAFVLSPFLSVRYLGF